jgi:hypothetical protein
MPTDNWSSFFFGLIGQFKKLQKQDVYNILNLAL